MAGREWFVPGRGPRALPPDVAAAGGEIADEVSDEALIARGDADGFVLLYRRHLPAIYRYAYARLGNRQDAEDLAALTFERAWARRGHYRATGPFRGWLFGIAHRAVVDRRRRDRPVPTPVEALAEALPDPAAGPEAAAISAEERALVGRIMAGLRPAQREILALRFFAGLPYDEIAGIVGKRTPAVKMLAYRALTALQEEVLR